MTRPVSGFARHESCSPPVFETVPVATVRLSIRAADRISATVGSSVGVSGVGVGAGGRVDVGVTTSVAVGAMVAGDVDVIVGALVGEAVATLVLVGDGVLVGVGVGVVPPVTWR